MTRSYRQYNTVMFVTAGAVLILIFAINTAFDPLWYRDGNSLGDVNYAFDERLSKVNQYLKAPAKYDCIVFGSSRTTLLNERIVEGRTCFNMSFSGGRIEELNAFADWVIKKGNVPKEVIVGVDDFNFIVDPKGTSIPEFITNQSNPPNIIESYATLDALRYSWFLFRRRSPLPRYYDRNFVACVLPGAGKYSPSTEKPKHVSIRKNAVDDYLALRRKFGQAKCIGYVPPISAWKVVSKSKAELENYLDSLHKISRFMKPFYDFSIPSSITRRVDNTYDGSHYYPEANRLVVDRIFGKTTDFGVRVDLLTREEYFQMYYEAVREFKASIEKTE